MKNNLVVPIVIAIVVAGGAGFFGGMQYQKGQVSSRFAQFGAGGFAGRTGGTRGGANSTNRPVTGQIIGVDNTGITVKLTDGSSKIVLVPDTAQINKATQGTKADLIDGQTVMVIGATNTDGSVTAQNIQLNPQTRMGGNGGGSGAPQAKPAQ